MMRVGDFGAPEQNGRMIEITRDERRLLEELTRHNLTLVTLQERGWLKDFIRNTSSSNRIIREMISRAHRSD